MIRLAATCEDSSVTATKKTPTKRRRFRLFPPIEIIRDEIQIAFQERDRINAELNELRRLHRMAEKRQLREREATAGAA